MLHIDPFLDGRRALLRIEESEYLRVHSFQPSLGVQIVLDILNPIESFSKAVLFMRDDASIFSKDHEKGHIIDDVLVLLRL